MTSRRSSFNQSQRDIRVSAGFSSASRPSFILHPSPDTECEKRGTCTFHGIFQYFRQATLSTITFPAASWFSAILHCVSLPTRRPGGWGKWCSQSRKAGGRSSGGKGRAASSPSGGQVAPARKRARTVLGTVLASNSGSGKGTGGLSGSRSGTGARNPLSRYGDDVTGDGWGEEEQEQEELEYYEDEPGDMDGLGWSEVWRRGDAGMDRALRGSGLDEHCRSLAAKVYIFHSA